MATTSLSVLDSQGNTKTLDASANPSNSDALIVHHGPPTQWAVNHNPGANTQATITAAAAGANKFHVCTAVSFSVASGATAPAAATQMVVNLRDGATGAGTVLCSWTIAIPAIAGAFNSVSLTGLAIVGSANTAMTLEFSAAGGSNTYQACNLIGYDIT